VRLALGRRLGQLDLPPERENPSFDADLHADHGSIAALYEQLRLGEVGHEVVVVDVVNHDWKDLVDRPVDEADRMTLRNIGARFRELRLTNPGLARRVSGKGAQLGPTCTPVY
jgi:hypothetical protein